MYFSSILFTMGEIKEAQKNGLKPPQYQITTSEIVSDYNKMVAFYNNNVPTASLSTIKQFTEEVKAFYLVVKDIYLELETDEMEKIYNDTRDKRESLIYKINTMESQSEQ